jgi:glucosamine-6-phosphate isomerase
MTIKLYPDYTALSRATADLIVEYINKKNDSIICLASGHTPRSVFECLVEDVKLNRLDISKCFFVSLDEWVGIAASQKGSCRQMMDVDFFNPLQIPSSHIKFFNGLTDDLESEVKNMNTFIKSQGGLDIMLVGIGTNGHIAMNEPGTSFDIDAHISTLAEETKNIGQKYFQESTILDSGITLGLKHFREAKLPILMANGEKKAAIIKQTFSSPPVESLPSSVIHLISQGYIMIDDFSAGKQPS